MADKLDERKTDLDRNTELLNDHTISISKGEMLRIIQTLKDHEARIALLESKVP